MHCEKSFIHTGLCGPSQLVSVLFLSLYNLWLRYFLHRELCGSSQLLGVLFLSLHNSFTSKVFFFNSIPFYLLLTLSYVFHKHWTACIFIFHWIFFPFLDVLLEFNGIPSTNNINWQLSYTLNCMDIYISLVCFSPFSLNFLGFVRYSSWAQCTSIEN